MKFWFSGEIDVRAHDSYRVIRQQVEARLNAQLGNEDYGAELERLAFIPMLLAPEFLDGKSERRLIQRKEKGADYRLIIDFEAWQSSSDEGRIVLLLKNVIASIQDIGRKLGSSFDAQRLQVDIARVFPEIANEPMHATCETHARDG